MEDSNLEDPTHKIGWETYSVYWRNQFNHTMMHTCTALSSKDAKEDFMKRVDQSQVKRITRIVKGFGMPKTTAKQALSHQYRSCIGACKMAEKNINSIDGRINATSAIDAKEAYKRMLLQTAAKKHIQNAERDIKDLFTRLGLKIK